jgi:hypothetical protein
MKLELKHIQPYLIHGVYCQYEGIINGKQRSEYDKEYNLRNKETPVLDQEDYLAPNEITGLKVAPIKRVSYWKDYTLVEIGVKSQGLKKFNIGYSDNPGFKLILQPLSGFWKGVTGGYVMELLQCDLSTVHEIWDLYSSKLKLEDVKLKTYNVMCKNHIDFNDLISQNLAVDKNTIES